MTDETAMTVAVIVLALFMGAAIIYSVWLSFQPRYARPVKLVAPLTAIGQEILPIRQAREIIESCWDNKERKPR